MKNNRKKLIIVMSGVLAVLIVIGIVIGVTQAKKQKELEEQGIYYQDGAESVEEWDDEELVDESEGTAAGDQGEAESVDEERTSAEDDTSGNNTGSKDDKSSDNKKNNNKNTSSGNKNTNNKGNNSSGNNSTGNTGNSSTGSTGNTGNTQDSGNGSSDKAPSKVPAAGKSTYEQYMAMTPEQQQKYFESFDSEKDFFDWYRKAKAEYDKKNDKNEISGGSIDIGDYMD